MPQDQGAPSGPGSRASHGAATHLHLSGFDPSRWTADRLVHLLDDWRNIPSRDFHARYPDFIGLRHDYYDKWPNSPSDEVTLFVVSKIATAIATETRRAETPQSGSVEDEGAGLQGIAQPESH